jgi:hypothetical protein
VVALRFIFSVRRSLGLYIKTGTVLLSLKSSESKDILYYLSELFLVRLLHIDLLLESDKKKSSD